MSTAYETFLKNLYMVEKYRLNLAMNANALHGSYAAGSTNPVNYPDARQLAFEAMGNNMPSITPPPPPQQSGFWEDIKKVAETVNPLHIAAIGPGKTALDILSRPMQGVENSILGSVKDVKKNGLGSNPIAEIVNAAALPIKHIPDFARGVSGTEHASGAKIIKELFPGSPSVAQGVGGFGLDVGLDPLSYINPITAGQKGNELANLLKGITSKGEVKAPEIAAPLASPAPAPLTPVAAPVANVQPLTAIPDAEALAAGVQAKQINTALSKAPNANPLDIPAPFKEITTAPVEAPVAAPITTPSNDIRLGTLRAMKAAILQAPDYKIGGRTIADFMANSPDQLESAVNKHVKDIYASRQFDKIPKEIAFTSKGGAANAAKLTNEQAAKLFSEGRVPGIKDFSNATDEFTHQFPIHDPGDLEGLTLKNSKGQVVTLGQYLKDLGIPVTKVYPGRPERPKFDIATAVPKPKVEAKAVYTKPKVVKMDTAELEQWSKEHLGGLTKTESDYLSKARSRKQFTDRLAELNAKRVTTGFKNIDEFVAAAKTGVIPQESIDKMLKITGAKSVDDLKSKVESVIAKTGKRTPTFADFAKETKGTVEKISGPSPDPRWDAANIIDQASQGDFSRIRKPIPEPNPTNLQDLAKALPEAILDNLITPAMKDKYPFVTKFKGARRTHAQPGVGRARNYHGWNSFSQSDVFRSLVQSASRRYYIGKDLSKAERRAAFARRPQQLYNEVMTNMRLADAALKKEGVKLIAGSDNSGLMLSLTDVLDSLPENIVKNYLFNMGGKGANVYPTAFLDAAAAIAEARLGKTSIDVARENAVNIVKTSGNLMDKDATARDVVRIIEDNIAPIMDRITANYAEHAIQVGESVKSMTDDVIHNVITKYADPSVSSGEAFGHLIDRNKELASAGTKLGAPSEALPTAKGITDLSLAKVIDPGDIAESNVARTIQATNTLESAATVGVRQQASRISEAEALANDSDVVNLGDLFNGQLQAGVFRANVPMLDKPYRVVDALGQAFMPHYGHAALHDMVWILRNVTQSFMRSHRALMQNAFNIAHKSGMGSEGLRESWKYIQDPSLIVADDPALTSIVQAMKNSTDLLFGSKEGNGSFAARNGLFASRLNKNLIYFGVPTQYSFKEGVPLVQQTEIWKKWTDVKDPLDLLDRVHAAFQKASVDVTIGRDFSLKFGKSTKLPGYVKLADPRGKSNLFPFIDSSLYYPGEIVDQLPFLEKVMAGTYNKSNKIVKFYDTLTHMFKAGATIYRPGHHVRNLIGDLTLAYLQGVNNPAVFRKAIRVMAGRSKQYQDWDGLKALQEGVGLSDTQSGGKIFTKIKGKETAIGDDATWRAAFGEGLLPDFRVLEDISFNELQPFQKLRKPFGGRVQKVAGGISMARDHWVRIAHFIDVLQKGNFNSLEEAYAQAGKTVRKWHPDGSDLTKFERNTMRRLIPFYSWMRKAIPLTVESLAMRPGRAMVIPKGFYNFAVANGVDPDTISNPFPSDQLFPNWLLDNNLGPEWRGGLPGIPGTGGQYPGRYHGFNPGDPITDITSNALGAHPNNFLAGNLTPFLKIPIEEQTGTILGTGSNITNQQDYLNSQIPMAGYAANIFNRNPIGGNPQQDVQRGNQQPGIDTMALFNFLTGLGIKDYSKPNYIRSAVLEMRPKNG